MVVRLTARMASLALGCWLLAGTLPARAETDCPSIDGPKCRIALPTGIEMAYLETGPTDGPAVILVHGLTDSSRSWSTTMDALHRLDPALHILAIDLRGHGASSMPAVAECAAAPEKCFRMTDFAADLQAFVAAKGIAKATLVGHSLGTFVVQEVALEHPELVERTVLVATAARGVDNVALRDFVLKEPVEGSWKAALEAKGKKYPDDFYELTPLDADPNAMDWMAKNWVVDPVAPEAFLKPYTPETAAVKLGTWIGATKALLATDNRARLPALVVPTLVLWGTQDSIFLAEPDQAEIKAALAAAAKHHGIEAYWKQYGLRPLPASGVQEDDIGHNTQWGAPEQVAADIDAFIKDGRPQSGLPRSEAPAQINKVVVDPDRTMIQSWP